MLTQKEVLKHRKIFSETDEKMAALFKVLSDVNRYRIFRFIVEQHEISVSAIAQLLDISLPLTSQHIKILTHARLVKKERSGKKVFPKLEYENPFVQAIIKTIQQAQKLAD